MVIDGDALGIVVETPSLVSNYPLAVLTPNVAEYSRFFQNTNLDSKQASLEELCKYLKVNVVRKGPSDFISNGDITLECSSPGGLRRCGGQGDVLAGILGTFLAWGNNAQKNGEKFDIPYPLLASFGSCYMTRTCSRHAFHKYKRATTTPNIIEKIGPVFEQTFPDTYEESSKL